MNQAILDRMAALRAKEYKIQATPEEELRLALSFIMNCQELQYPYMQGAITLLKILAPQIHLISLTFEQNYDIRCENCGKYLGRCSIRPLRISCCGGKAPLISSYSLDLIGYAFNLSPAQDKELEFIYNCCLEDYYNARN